MRQIVDFLVCIGLIVVLSATVYFTPKIVDYMSRDHADRHVAAGDDNDGDGLELALSPQPAR